MVKKILNVNNGDIQKMGLLNGLKLNCLLENFIKSVGYLNIFFEECQLTLFNELIWPNLVGYA